MKHLRWYLFALILIGYLAAELFIFKPFSGPPPLHPQEISDPSNALYYLPVITPHKTLSHKVEVVHNESRLVKYHWDLAVPDPIEEVLQFYEKKLPSISIEKGKKSYSFSFTPTGASEPETTTVRIGRYKGATVLSIDQLVIIPYKNPLRSLAILVRICTALTLLGLLLAKRWFTILWVDSVKRKLGGTITSQYSPLDQLPAEIAQTENWLHKEEALKKQGFFPIGDYNYVIRGERGYLRAFQEPTRMVTAALYYQGGNVSTELLSFYEQGIVLRTTTLPHPEQEILPNDLIIESLPPTASVGELLEVHRVARAKVDEPPVAVSPDLFPKLWELIDVEPFIRVKRDKNAASPLKSIADRCIGYIPDPPPIEEEAPEEKQRQEDMTNFTDDLLQRVQSKYPDWSVRKKARLELILTKPGFDPRDIDLESLYYMLAKPGIDKEKAIENFIAGLSRKLS